MRLFYLVYLVGIEAYPKLALNSEINGVQTSEWSYFELPVSDYYHAKGSLRFTLSFEDTAESPLVLAISSIIPALFDSKGKRVFANFVDYNGWHNSNSKQFIIIPAYIYNSTFPVYISVGSPRVPSTPLNFSLSSEYSEGPLCPNDCSGRGVCHENTCICQSGYINYDCGTPAVEIDDDAWAIVDIPVNSTRYGYFYLREGEFFRLKFEWTGPMTMISLNWRGYSISELPSESSYYIRTLLTSSDDCKEIIYSTDTIKSQIVYMAIMNLYSTSEDVHLKIRLASNSTTDQFELPVFQLIIGIFTSIFVVLLIIITVKYNQVIPESFTARTPAPAGISAEIINQTCPHLKYRDLDGDAESNCMVCLEEFKTGSKVRRLRCKHVFHAKCIDEWFKSNVHCCLCKRDCSVLDDFSMTAEHLVSANI